MKTLVLNGSPRREKSDTMHITRAFLDGVKEVAPQDVHIVDIIDKGIKIKAQMLVICAKFSEFHSTITSL
mgnify:CR=1 FL=1